jgi:uncharacterized membrane protein YhaH (DUF805 family)
MAVVTGRMKRLRFFVWYLLLGLVGFVLGCAIKMFRTGSSDFMEAMQGFTLEIALVSVLLLYFPVVKRLHDMGRSGWLYLLMFIPVANFVMLLFLLFKRGDPSDNQYGPA